MYFDDTEHSVSIAALPANSSPTTTTGSVVAGPSFHTFILPGETRIQASYTYEIDRTDSTFGNRTFYLNTFIANSITGSYSGTPSKYGLFDTQATVGSSTIDFAPSSSLKSGANNVNYTSTQIEDRQGIYALIHTTLAISNTAGSPGPAGTIKLKNFVFRTSRSVGSSISAPALPIGSEPA